MYHIKLPYIVESAAFCTFVQCWEMKHTWSKIRSNMIFSCVIRWTLPQSTELNLRHFLCISLNQIHIFLKNLRGAGLLGEGLVSMHTNYISLGWNIVVSESETAGLPSHRWNKDCRSNRKSMSRSFLLLLCYYSEGRKLLSDGKGIKQKISKQLTDFLLHRNTFFENLKNNI